jgi:putative peptide zinc metalloprotease protein
LGAVAKVFKYALFFLELAFFSCTNNGLMNNPATPLPELRADLHFYPSAPTAQGAPTWVVLDPVSHRYYNIGRLEYEILRRWQAGSSEELATRVNAETSLKVVPFQIDQLLQSLKTFQLIRVSGPEAIKELVATQEKLKKAKNKFKNPLSLLFLRIPLFRPDRFLNATYPLARPFMSAAFLKFTALMGLLAIYLVSRQWDSFIATFPHFFSLEGMLILAVAMVVTKTFHELGHAYKTKSHGLEVPSMGVMLLLFFPVLYTDTSSAWRLRSRRERVWIDAAGVVAELIVAVYATLLWVFLPDGAVRSAAFMLAAVTWITALFFNLNPFMRFDGYYLLADAWGIANLQPRAFKLARWRIREWIFAFGEACPERFPPWQRRMVIVYAFLTWAYRIMVFIGIGLIILYFLEDFKLLGLYLFVMGMFGFLAKPVLAELQEWWKRRADMRWNSHTIVSVLLIGAFIALLSVPWRSSVEVPALFRSGAEYRVYAPVSGQLQEVHVQSGQTVEAGATLFVLDDPESRWQLEVARRRAEVLRLQRDLQPADRSFLERGGILNRQLAEAQANIKRYEERLQSLHITAPFAGIVAQMDDNLSPGRWLNPSTLLALLIEPTSTQLTAYADEVDLRYLQVGNQGRFYPHGFDLEPFAVEIKEIDAANIQFLPEQDAYLASVYQGGIAVTPAQNQGMAPQLATYRLRLHSLAPQIFPEKVTRGEVLLRSEQSHSLLERGWLALQAVLIRESGF